MADPVIVDDGGSLRLRPGVNGPIDGLLDGVADVNAASAFATLRVEHHAKDGTNHLHPPGVGTTALAAGDVVTIASASGHVVQATLVSATDLRFDLTTGNPVAVEARSSGAGNRVYRITNADKIRTVTHSRAGVVFDDTAGGPALTSAFAIVVFL